MLQKNNKNTFSAIYVLCWKFENIYLLYEDWTFSALQALHQRSLTPTMNESGIHQYILQVFVLCILK